MNLIDAINTVATLPNDKPICISGKSFCGKTSFLLELMVAMNKPSIYISLEDTVENLSSWLKGKYGNRWGEQSEPIGIIGSFSSNTRSVGNVIERFNGIYRTLVENSAVEPRTLFIDNIDSLETSDMRDMVTGEPYRKFIDDMTRNGFQVIYTTHRNSAALDFKGEFPRWCKPDYLIEVSKSRVDAGDELLFGIQFFGEIGKPTLTFKQKEKIVFGELV